MGGAAGTRGRRRLHLWNGCWARRTALVLGALTALAAVAGAVLVLREPPERALLAYAAGAVAGAVVGSLVGGLAGAVRDTLTRPRRRAAPRGAWVVHRRSVVG